MVAAALAYHCGRADAFGCLVGGEWPPVRLLSWDALRVLARNDDQVDVQPTGSHTQFMLLRCCPAWRDWFGWTTCGFCFQAAHITLFSESRHPHTRQLSFYPKCSECRIADRAA